jgi:hypothetical protein
VSATSFPEIVVAGGPFERGRQHGQQVGPGDRQHGRKTSATTHKPDRGRDQGRRDPAARRSDRRQLREPVLEHGDDKAVFGAGQVQHLDDLAAGHQAGVGGEGDHRPGRQRLDRPAARLGHRADPHHRERERRGCG